MKVSLSALLCSFLLGVSKADINSVLLQGQYPFYHSTEQIHQELHALAENCPALTVTSQSRTNNKGETVSIDAVTVRSTDATPINKVFILYGEHARELISPESGLHFAKVLCGKVPALADWAKKTLAHSEFQMVVNGNPLSRKKVEGGEFCLRVNEQGTDLNRNWDEHWQAQDSLGADTAPGATPFSEPETQIFKELVVKYKPTMFLTVHSGTYGMYMPWAYSITEANRNKKQMHAILSEVDKSYCNCPFGAAGKEVGYECPGTCVDWVYDKLGVPFSFAWEIYTDNSRKEELYQEWKELSQANSFLAVKSEAHLASSKYHKLFSQFPSSFVQLSAATQQKHDSSDSDMSSQECMFQFNPTTQQAFDDTLFNWSQAYLKTADLVTEYLKKGDYEKLEPAAVLTSVDYVEPVLLSASTHHSSIRATDLTKQQQQLPRLTPSLKL
eukprot:GDKI01021468.1.p1 GENE.GDKI01021468.1~~GDKI01021468.1.p1  ORF type:complete len:484 (+),score=143.58 GDKI01021468.1:126-1454(+)